MSMTLSQPGPPLYKAVLFAYELGPGPTQITCRFYVDDAAGNRHNGLDASGAIADHMDVVFDTTSLPSDIQAAIRQAIQQLVLAEYVQASGGDTYRAMEAFVQSALGSEVVLS